MQPLDWLKKLARSETGNALVIAAATLPLMIGAAAIGVDTIQVSVAKRQLQRAADSAALAGAYAIVQTQPVATSVNHDLGLNDDVALSSSPVIENAPTTGPFAGNPRAVRVALAARRSVPFISFFTGSTMDVSAEATAAVVFAGQYCMVSLENGNVTGVNFTGSTVVDLGCGVATNSRSNTAIYASGNARVRASPIGAVGGVPTSGAYQSGTVLLPYSPPQADPFAHLPRTPTPPSDCVTLDLNPNGNQAVTFPPLGASRSYCIPSQQGKNPAKIQANLTLPSATYYIQGGTLDFGPATVTGEGVTFVLTTGGTEPGVATLNMNANAVLQFTAPSSGTYQGVLMYQDSRAAGGTNQINGNAASRLRGAFYFPSSDLVFNGAANMTITCLQLVALHLSFSGNSSITNSCPEDSGARAFDAIFVRLVD